MKWHKGPPPSVGWWPASIGRTPNVFRWWNGKWWSDCAGRNTSKRLAGAIARSISRYQSDIEWTDRPANWPERSKT